MTTTSTWCCFAAETEACTAEKRAFQLSESELLYQNDDGDTYVV